MVLRTRSILAVIGLIGLGWGLASEALYYGAGTPADDVLLDLAIGWTYLFGGLGLWASQPANRIGRLMTLVGFAWFIGNLAVTQLAGIRELGMVFSGVAAAALVALVLAYPRGQLETTLDRLVVATVSVGWLATGVALLRAGTDPQLGAAVLLLNGLLAGIAGVAIIRRWVAAPTAARHELRPVLLAGVIQMLVLAIFVVVQDAAVPEDVAALLLAAKNLAPAAIPLGMLVGFYRESEMRQHAVASELQRSRTRIVEATDAARRGLERDLHDGAQQRLVALSLALRLARARVRPGASEEEIAELDHAVDEVKVAISELRELARGIHPAILTQAGLGPAIESLVGRSGVGATVLALPDRRFDTSVEATAYFIVAESLSNVAKYASATQATVLAECPAHSLRIEVADDGIGGADPAGGTGLRGLADRVTALGGSLSVLSPPGGGTRVIAEIPIA